MAGQVSLTPLPPAEAIRYFQNKGYQESFAWQDVWQEEHVRAFTVAKAMRRDILQDIRDALDQALKEGMTLGQFQARLTPILQAKGWWGRQDMVDPKTGETVNVQLGSPRRLKTIFETNMRVAYNVGRWERFQRTKDAFPFLRYNHTPQEHPRPEHQAWDGTILPIDDPWWNTHFTPNGWNCKCYITQTNARLMAARGESLTARPIKFPPRPYTNPRTGEISVIERGLDPGWAYNPGKAYLEGLTPKPAPGGPGGAPTGDVPGRPDKPASEGQGAPGAPAAARAAEPSTVAAPEIAALPAVAVEPVQSPARADGAAPPASRDADRALERGELADLEAHPGPAELPADVTGEEAQASFLHGFGLAPNESKVFIDAGGEPFIAGPGLFKTSADTPATYSAPQLRALPLVSAAIRLPAEIRWVWLEGKNGKSLLVRRYIARFLLGDQAVDVVVDSAPAGGSPSWSFATSLDSPKGLDLDGLRIGYLAWSKGKR